MILMIEIRNNRKEPVKEYLVSNIQEIQNIEPEIKEAYKAI